MAHIIRWQALGLLTHHGIAFQLDCLHIMLYISAADDSSRVVLSVPNTSGTDYINASFVDVSEACTAVTSYNYSIFIFMC